MSSPERGIWVITEEGRKRVQGDEGKPDIRGEQIAKVHNLIEVYEEYETEFREQLLDKLHELEPREFELFSRKLLTAYGFVKMKITSIGNDGYGRLKVGLARMNVAFQCKRWSSNVSRI